jgi:hypothetical protein
MVITANRAVKRIERNEAVIDSLRVIQDSLERENDMMFRQQVQQQQRLDNLIYGNVPEDSVLMKLYDLRNGD